MDDSPYLGGEQPPPLHGSRFVDVEALLDHVKLDQPAVALPRIGDGLELILVKPAKK